MSIRFAKWRLAWLCVSAVGGGAMASANMVELVGPTTPPSWEQTWDFIDLYCIDCHASDIRKGEVNLEVLSQPGEIFDERHVWEQVQKQLQVAAMPPDDEMQPELGEREAIADWLHETLTFVDTSKPVDPGRVTVRRLNRKEYDNTIQDLFGINLSLATTFPGDNVGYGFDNIGDVHTVSPLRMERFLAAAERVADLVVNTGQQLEIDVNEQAVFYDRFDITASSDAGVIIDPAGRLEVTYETPLPGEYELAIRAWGVMPQSVFEERGVDNEESWPEHANAWRPEDSHPVVPMQLVVNGKIVDTLLVRQGESSRDWQTYKLRFDVPIGVQDIAFQMGEPEGWSAAELEAWRADPPRLGIREARMTGPYSVDTQQLDPLHQLVVTTQPGPELTVAEAARRILEPVGHDAFRRPLTEEELARHVAFVESFVADGETFQVGITAAIEALLVSPHFIYRFDVGPAPLDAETIHPIGDYALASRLSYFMWGSMPDEELFALAESGEIQQDDVLAAQVKRMLAHPRSEHFKAEFFRQWLDLRKLRSLSIDDEVFKAFSLDLKRDVETETLLFVGSIIEDNGTILDMLTADYSFINKRIAKVYGIAGFESSEFQRVSLRGMPRRGLLTQPSILMLTSYPNRTSPTKRGNWILEAILGDEPPDAPANVPTLEEAQASKPDLTLRDHLELHRTNPTCASCHATMDPIGLGLENFNAIGEWRVTDGGLPVNASGELPDGSTFDEPLELLEILIAREDDFARNFVRKLMTFALGRGLEYYDRVAVDDVLAHTAADGYRIVDIAQEVVLSRPFRLQRGDPLYED